MTYIIKRNNNFAISFGVNSASTTCSGADTNTDNVVDILEIMNYITEWKANNVDILDLMIGIGEWKSGCA